MSHPSDQVMGATGTPTCAPPNLERLEVDSKILHSSTHQRSVSPIAAAAASCQCYFREGKLDLARIWDQEDQGSGNGRAILPLSLSPALLGSAVPTFQGRLEYKGPRAKCFIREKKRKKAVPFCRTQGCPANTEVPLLCVTEQSGKGRNVEPGLPNGKKLLQTVSLQYVQSTL